MYVGPCITLVRFKRGYESFLMRRKLKLSAVVLILRPKMDAIYAKYVVYID